MKSSFINLEGLFFGKIWLKKNLIHYE